MKIQWSVFFSLLLLMTLASCGSEQFGTVPKSQSEKPDALSSYAHSSCSAYTLIKPKVDVLYVIDNSSSTYYIANDIKSALSNTINSLSKSFDYRVIGTPLLETAGGNQDYQVMTNSSDLAGIPSDGRRVTSAAGFSFFGNTPVYGQEKGLDRVVRFVDTHKNSLIRNNAYLMIVLVSNGRDQEVEVDSGFGNGETTLNSTVYNARLTSMRSLRTQLNSLQFRMLSVTAKNVCVAGYRTAHKSYVKMSNQLYVDSLATDSNTTMDAYDLCISGGISSIFAAINNSIQQVVLPHQYGYWPITFAENNEMVSTNDIRVRKVSSNGSSVELVRNTEWFYENPANPETRNLRIGPNPTPGPGEPHTSRHFIRFVTPIVYPDCVLVTSVSKTEYFGYVVLSQKPKSPISANVTIRINGAIVPGSAMFDETSTVQTRNIKVDHPTGTPPGTANPPAMRTGYMIRLAPSHYYKSGDDVQVSFNPAGI